MTPVEFGVSRLMVKVIRGIHVSQTFLVITVVLFSSQDKKTLHGFKGVYI